MSDEAATKDSGCDCVSKVNDHLAAQNGRLVMGLRIAPGMRVIGRLMLQTEKLDKNKRGPRPPLVSVTFCPFCGQKAV